MYPFPAFKPLTVAVLEVFFVIFTTDLPFFTDHFTFLLDLIFTDLPAVIVLEEGDIFHLVAAEAVPVFHANTVSNKTIMDSISER